MYFNIHCYFAVDEFLMSDSDFQYILTFICWV
jgi:hypothetical protein